MTPEGKVKALLKKRLDAMMVQHRLWYFMPVAGPFSEKGVPDFIGAWDGQGFAIETKAEGGKTTKLQEIKMAEMRDAGMHVFVCVGVDGVADTIFNLTNAIQYRKP